jgi:hypothetical protein
MIKEFLPHAFDDDPLASSAGKNSLIIVIG